MHSRLHPSGPPEVSLWRRLFGYLDVVHLEIRIRMIIFLVLLTRTKVLYLIILLVQEKLLMLHVCCCTCRSSLLCSGLPVGSLWCMSSLVLALGKAAVVVGPSYFAAKPLSSDSRDGSQWYNFCALAPCRQPVV